MVTSKNDLEHKRGRILTSPRSALSRNNSVWRPGGVHIEGTVWSLARLKTQRTEGARKRH